MKAYRKAHPMPPMTNAELVAYQLGEAIGQEFLSDMAGTDPTLNLGARTLTASQADALAGIGDETFAYWVARGTRDVVFSGLTVERPVQDGC